MTVFLSFFNELVINSCLQIEIQSMFIFIFIRASRSTVLKLFSAFVSAGCNRETAAVWGTTVRSGRFGTMASVLAAQPTRRTVIQQDTTGTIMAR